MREAEAREFAASPYGQASCQLRRWDDAAKQPGAPTPPIDHFRPLLGSLVRARDVVRPPVPAASSAGDDDSARGLLTRWFDWVRGGRGCCWQWICGVRGGWWRGCGVLAEVITEDRRVRGG
ncbi:MAG TPA: hypothetical protein VN695_20145 [Streptosporangiaceae bacterium]|nr:hypothetical protein [Streptosporangiaceae bacterium]